MSQLIRSEVNANEASCLRACFSSLPRTRLQKVLEGLTLDELRMLSGEWGLWASPAQMPPEGDWRLWLFLAGRGAGKTRAGAEWLGALARTRQAGRMALIGPTLHDAREVMVEGPSGLLATHKPPRHDVSRRRLVWENGAQAHYFSAEEPYRLRGPQFDAAWGDEFAYWPQPEEVLSTLTHALRLGRRPRALLTTTPRPIAAIRSLVSRPDVAVTRATVWDNAAGLAPDYLAALGDPAQLTAYQRQELLGEVMDEAPDALWARSQIEQCYEPLQSETCWSKVIIAIDPPAGMGAGADSCGIVAAGSLGEGASAIAYILADATSQGLPPLEWAKRAAALARQLRADAIVAEANNGGEMVRTVLRLAAPDIPIRLVRASAAKHARAAPIAALYAQGRVRHASRFPALEDEMCRFGGADWRGSPDRLDAMVWAVSELLLNSQTPRLRAL